MDERCDAIVIGAGPAGTAAAILLARAGWAVALVERQTFPRRKVCGECIAATNLALLEELGAGEAFGALAGPPLRRVAIMAGEYCVSAALPPLESQAGGRHRWGRALGRERLDALLLERARQAGARILQPWTVRAIGGGPGAWSCDVEEGGNRQRRLRLAAPLLISAHGSWHGAPRRQGEDLSGGARRPAGAADLFAFKANFSGACLDDGLLPVLALKGGYGGMVVAEQGMATLACCIRRDRLARIRRAAPGLSAGEAVERWLIGSTAGVRQALDGARRCGTWLAAGPIRPGLRLPRDHAGAPFLVGNAAGEAHPIIGEGISMAMQSSWLLCGLLLAENRGGRVPAAAAQQRIAQEYASQWRRNFAPRMGIAAVFARLAMRPDLAPALLPLLRRAPALLTHAARLSGKVRRLSAADAAPAA